ncbi:YggT family protein [Sulfurirhabdus autotrophica]|uniref:YggT family protein n=1 Tax=Sulfurirhabdus autotrophica TaxID=1706046 RepID=A0A4V6P3Y4_9PROT|nr:YggT family protein [Sulfurirhabdus autotrophica]TCV88079.1 YggT family protein [Sulfurirhabdus autotrophica]
MLIQALQFILDTILGLFIYALLLRFYLQLMRAAYSNPISQFIAALTDFVVKPARKIIPGLFGVDLSTLFLAWITALLLTVGIYFLNGYPFLLANPSAYLGFILLAAVTIIEKSLYLLIFVQIMLFVLSFANPHSPYMSVISSLSRPFTKIVQKFIPPIGNVDLSPMVIVLACQLMLMLPVAFLTGLAKSLI